MHTSNRSRRARRPARALVALAVLLAAAACTDDPDVATGGDDDRAVDCTPTDDVDRIDLGDAAVDADAGVTVKLGTHDSFAVGDGVLESFTAETGIEVEVVALGDAGEAVSQAILTAGEPVVDVLYGVDTTFVCRAIAADVFVPYRAAGLDRVPDALLAPGEDRVTPIDVGDVCLNYSKAAFPDPSDAPQDLDDLLDERFADAFVTEDPASSSPGLAFLLATIATYGDGWEAYWEGLRENGVAVASGWSEAYEDDFGAGAGERTIVTSYASSPVADVLFSDPPRDEPAIGVVADACFRQVEYAGVLRGTGHPTAAARLVDFLLSPTFQADIPLNMFVEPAREDVALPPEFEAHRTPIDDPITLDPAEIEAGRDRWTERWTEIVLR
ncbi:MAG: thiamine ABC transporter substrate-binding protein [Acidimicrobiales bacterium]|nr:thiamine ABC transporter substrate-binding protein [Acidimicrobiales bacterium]